MPNPFLNSHPKERIATVLIILATVLQFGASIIQSKIDDQKNQLQNELINIANHNAVYAGNSAEANLLLQNLLICLNAGQKDNLFCKAAQSGYQDRVSYEAYLENSTSTQSYTADLAVFEKNSLNKSRAISLLNYLFFLTQLFAVILLLWPEKIEKFNNLKKDLAIMPEEKNHIILNPADQQTRYEWYLDRVKERKEWAEKMSESKDKFIFALAGGAIVLSVNFLHELLNNDNIQHIKILQISWALLLITLGLNLATFVFGIKTTDKEKTILDKWLNSNKKDAPTLNTTYSKITQWCDIISAITLIFGLLFLVCFASLNIK